MVTALTIFLVVLVVINIWYTIGAVKFQKDAKRKLQERIDEFNKATDLHVAELEGAKHRVNEAIAETAKIKSNYEMLLKEHEELVQAYKELRKEYEHAQEHTISGDPHAEHQDPVNGEEPGVHTEHGDPANKPNSGLAIDKKPAKKKRVYTPKKK